MNTPPSSQGRAKYSLTDLVSLEKLQKIQDLFAHANGIASTIIELDGTPITKPSNHSKICKLIRQSDLGRHNCMISGAALGLQAKKTQKPFHKKCLSCGFSDAAAPIIVNGHHIANWVVGQYHIRDVGEQRVKEYAREIGADEEEMTTAFMEMETISTEQFEKILDFVWVIANEISNMGYLNLKQMQQTEELQTAKSLLEEQQQNLEKIIEARTTDLLQVNAELQNEINDKTKLQRMQSRLVAAVENADESIIITNTIPEILYVNPAFEKVTGYSREEVMGRNPSILSSGLHDTSFYDQLWETIQRGETWKGRFRNKDKNGEIHDEETTISPVKNSNDDIINYVSIKRDITKRLEMERQILQMSKMEAIGTLAAGIAHEINTPIQYVTDNTHFLKDVFNDYQELINRLDVLRTSVREEGLYPHLTDTIDAFIEEIEMDYLRDETGKAIEGSLEGLHRIATVVRAMKDFSHPGGKEKEKENINRLIESTVTVSTNEWKNSAEVELNLSESIPTVPVYSGYIKQALLNIVVNAAHAIEEKESVEKGRITISTDYSCNSVVITVSDSGIGIPDDIVDHIFDPFFTTKTVGKGTGQGLTMVHSTIVDGHGGTLSVDSEYGRGSTFTITLPLTEKEEASGNRC